MRIDMHYVVVGEGDGPRDLSPVAAGTEFAQEGARVLVIHLPHGERHLINFGPDRGADDCWELKDGILRLFAWTNGPWLRTYRDWSYFEWVAYKAPGRPRPPRRIRAARAG